MSSSFPQQGGINSNKPLRCSEDLQQPQCACSKGHHVSLPSDGQTAPSRQSLFLGRGPHDLTVSTQPSRTCSDRFPELAAWPPAHRLLQQSTAPGAGGVGAPGDGTDVDGSQAPLARTRKRCGMVPSRCHLPRVGSDGWTDLSWPSPQEQRVWVSRLSLREEPPWRQADEFKRRPSWGGGLTLPSARVPRPVARDPAGDPGIAVYPQTTQCCREPSPSPGTCFHCRLLLTFEFGEARGTPGGRRGQTSWAPRQGFQPHPPHSQDGHEGPKRQSSVPRSVSRTT